MQWYERQTPGQWSFAQVAPAWPSGLLHASLPEAGQRLVEPRVLTGAPELGAQAPLEGCSQARCVFLLPLANPPTSNHCRTALCCLSLLMPLLGEGADGTLS